MGIDQKLALLELKTFAGSGQAGHEDGPRSTSLITKPHGLYCDPNGDLYITELRGHRIRKIEATTNSLKTVAGNGRIGSRDGGFLESSSTFSSSLHLGRRRTKTETWPNDGKLGSTNTQGQDMEEKFDASTGEKISVSTLQPLSGVSTSSIPSDRYFLKHIADSSSLLSSSFSSGSSSDDDDSDSQYDDDSDSSSSSKSSGNGEADTKHGARASHQDPLREMRRSEVRLEHSVSTKDAEIARIRHKRLFGKFKKAIKTGESALEGENETRTHQSMGLPPHVDHRRVYGGNYISDISTDFFPLSHHDLSAQNPLEGCGGDLKSPSLSHVLPSLHTPTLSSPIPFASIETSIFSEFLSLHSQTGMECRDSSTFSSTHSQAPSSSSKTSTKSKSAATTTSACPLSVHSVLDMPEYIIGISSLPSTFLWSDYGSSLLRMYHRGLVTTLAGKQGSGFVDAEELSHGQFSMPRGGCLGPNGCLYLADFGHNMIRVIDISKSLEETEKVVPSLIDRAQTLARSSTSNSATTTQIHKQEPTFENRGSNTSTATAHGPVNAGGPESQNQRISSIFRPEVICAPPCPDPAALWKEMPPAISERRTMWSFGKGQCETASGSFDKASFASPYQIILRHNHPSFFVGEWTKIRIVHWPSHEVETYAGKGRGKEDGPRLRASFCGIVSLIETHNSSQLFVSEYTNNCIRRIDASTGLVSTLVGGRHTSFLDHLQMKASEENLLAESSTTHSSTPGVKQTQKKSNRDSTLVNPFTSPHPPSSTTASGFLDGPLNAALLNSPMCLEWNAHGDLLIADSQNHVIRIIHGLQEACGALPHTHSSFHTSYTVSLLDPAYEERTENSVVNRHIRDPFAYYPSWETLGFSFALSSAVTDPGQVSGFQNLPFTVPIQNPFNHSQWIHPSLIYLLSSSSSSSSSSLTRTLPKSSSISTVDLSLEDPETVGDLFNILHGFSPSYLHERCRDICVSLRETGEPLEKSVWLQTITERSVKVLTLLSKLGGVSTSISRWLGFITRRFCWIAHHDFYVLFRALPKHVAMLIEDQTEGEGNKASLGHGGNFDDDIYTVELKRHLRAFVLPFPQVWFDDKYLGTNATFPTQNETPSSLSTSLLPQPRLISSYMTGEEDLDTRTLLEQSEMLRTKGSLHPRLTQANDEQQLPLVPPENTRASSSSSSQKNTRISNPEQAGIHDVSSSSDISSTTAAAHILPSPSPFKRILSRLFWNHVEVLENPPPSTTTSTTTNKNDLVSPLASNLLISADGRRWIHCHDWVLVMKWKWLAQVLKSGMNEAVLRRVSLPQDSGISHQTLLTIIQYLYTNEIDGSSFYRVLSSAETHSASTPHSTPTSPPLSSSILLKEVHQRNILIILEELIRYGDQFGVMELHLANILRLNDDDDTSHRGSSGTVGNNDVSHVDIKPTSNFEHLLFLLRRDFDLQPKSIAHALHSFPHAHRLGSKNQKLWWISFLVTNLEGILKDPLLSRIFFGLGGDLTSVIFAADRGFSIEWHS